MRSIVAAAVLSIAMPLGAATFTVTRGADNGLGTLRWAIEQANAAAGPDSIDLAGLTVRPTRPLPPITDYVDISGGTIDGSLAGDTDGLLLRNYCNLSSVTVTNFSGDGIVVDTVGAQLHNLTVSHNRNGIQIRGNRNIVVGSWIVDNHAAGIWVTGSENLISQPETWDLAPPPFPTSTDVIAGNQNGIVLDGGGNVVNGAMVRTWSRDAPTGNRGDGIVVNHEGNQILSCDVRDNGGNGVTLNAPSEVTQTTGCNTGPLIAGVTQPVPHLFSAISDATVTTVDGGIEGAPNSPYRIEMAAPDLCFTRSSTFEIETDGSGIATFHFLYPFSTKTISATATLLGKSGNATSAMSPPFASVTSAVSPSDLETIIFAPRTAMIGGLVTIEIHVINHGPSPINGAILHVDYPYLESVDWTTSSGDCWLSGLKRCVFGTLAPGETAIVQHRLRVIRGNAWPTYVANAIASSDGTVGAVDPDPSNNGAMVTIEPEAGRGRAVRH